MKAAQSARLSPATTGSALSSTNAPGNARGAATVEMAKRSSRGRIDPLIDGQPGTQGTRSALHAHATPGTPDAVEGIPGR